MSGVLLFVAIFAILLWVGFILYPEVASGEVFADWDLEDEVEETWQRLGE